MNYRSEEKLKSKSRPRSILLTPFSVKQTELTTVLYTLTEAIHDYPVVEDYYSPLARNPSDVIIRLAEEALTKVSSLTLAMSESVPAAEKPGIHQSSRISLFKLNSCLAFESLAAHLQVSTGELLTDLKERLETEELDDPMAKEAVHASLVKISDMATELMQFTNKLHRKKNSKVISVHTTLPNGKRTCEPMDETQEIDADGEGFAKLLKVSATYNQMKSFECNACSRDMKMGDCYIVYSGRQFHQQCFRCCKCNGIAPTGTFLTKNGNPICEQCSPCCASCSKTVTSECFLALNRAYHLPCFKCILCQTVIDPDAMFYEKSHQPCCSECILKARVTVFQTVWSPSVDSHTMSHSNTMSTFAGYDPSTHMYDESIHSEDEEEHFEFSPFQKTQSRVYTSGLPTPPPRRVSQDPTAANSKDPKLPFAPTLDHTKRQQLFPQGSIPAPSQSTDSKDKVKLRPTLANMGTLPCILAHVVGVDCLIRFCMRENGLENIFFWMDVEMFRMQQEAHLRFWADKIYQKYIGGQSELPVKLSGRVLQALTEAMNMGNSLAVRKAFDLAQKEIYNRMETVMLPRFTRSIFGQAFFKFVIMTKVRQHIHDGKSILIFLCMRNDSLTHDCCCVEAKLKQIEARLPSLDILMKRPDFLLLIDVSSGERKNKKQVSPPYSPTPKSTHTHFPFFFV